MKPLELTVYQIDRTNLEDVVVNGIWEYRPYDRSKRLTDAELAAEFWSANAIAWDVVANRGSGVARLDEQCDVLERFATLPHYDEAQS